MHFIVRFTAFVISSGRNVAIEVKSALKIQVYNCQLGIHEF